MKKTIIALSFGALLLTGCAASQGQNQYKYNEVGQSTIVEFATIIDVREVGITGRNTGGGAMVGGLAGAGAGSYAGGGSGQAWTTIGGAILGGIAGAAIEQEAADKKGIEYTLVTEGGKPMTIVQNQNAGDKTLSKGERVIVQTTGTYQRVLPAGHLPEAIKRPKGIKIID